MADKVQSYGNSPLTVIFNMPCDLVKDNWLWWAKLSVVREHWDWTGQLSGCNFPKVASHSIFCSFIERLLFFFLYYNYYFFVTAKRIHWQCLSNYYDQMKRPDIGECDYDPAIRPAVFSLTVGADTHPGRTAQYSIQHWLPGMSNWSICWSLSGQT